MRGKVRQRPVRRAVVLHEHQVPVLQKAVCAGGGPPVGAKLGPAVEVEFGVGAARPGRAELPEVLGFAECLDALARDAHVHPVLDGLVVGGDTGHAFEHGDPDLLGIEPEHLGGQLVAEPHGIALEVVAEREVAEHLEERQVAGGPPDLVDVECAKALLAARRARRGRLGRPEEVLLERLHPGNRQEDRGVVLVWDERRGWHRQVSALLEKLPEAPADVVGRHRGGKCTSVLTCVRVSRTLGLGLRPTKIIVELESLIRGCPAPCGKCLVQVVPKPSDLLR